MTKQEAINKIRMYIEDIADIDDLLRMYNWFASKNTSYNSTRYQWICEMDELEYELKYLTVPELIELGKNSDEFYSTDAYAASDDNGDLVSFDEEFLNHLIDEYSQDMAEYAVDFEDDLNSNKVYEIIEKYVDDRG